MQLQQHQQRRGSITSVPSSPLLTPQQHPLHSMPPLPSSVQPSQPWAATAASNSALLTTTITQVSDLLSALPHATQAHVLTLLLTQNQQQQQQQQQQLLQPLHAFELTPTLGATPEPSYHHTMQQQPHGG